VKTIKFAALAATAAATAFGSLSFKVSKKDDENKICDVRYANVTRQKLESFFDDIDDDFGTQANNESDEEEEEY
jgi:hypothetical protein